MGANGVGSADSGGTVIWVTGLAEAGKTTVARELVRQLLQRGQQPILLDGNQVRTALGMTSGFDRESRIKASMTYGRLSQLLAEQGHVVVVATISLFHEVQQWNRENQPDYFEVLLDVPVEELQRRDSKGVYSGNDAKDIVGIGQSAEFPTDPDLVVTNYGDIDPKAAATMIRLAHEQRLSSAVA
ncbi:adenylyl-sulfate kinase [Streptomyces sp. NPDC046465]|uniref:adenylyl-sulfate kinase n=1 Tax=Streptomyces sp. NPDC046465 TaxID=3155810 RepID=UPI0033D5BCD6